MRYTPNSVPDPATRAELERIAYALAQPQVGVVLYEVQQSVPPRLQAGMVCYFAAGVVGGAEGLYQYSAGVWVRLAGGSGPLPPSPADAVPAAVGYGGAGAVGVSLDYAREDHVHAGPAAGPLPPSPADTAPAAIGYGGAGVVGASLDYAREDHVHAGPPAPVLPNPADAAPLAPGAAAVGASLDYAREDHVHPAQVNVTGSSGSCTGNAASATTAAACTGNAATATTAGACTGNAATATTANNALACSGNAATASSAAACTGNAASATTANNALACSGNAATASSAAACTGNSATATSAAACTGNSATATSAPTQAADDNSTKIATTAYVIGQASVAVPLLAAGAGAVGASLRYARADHVHPASLLPGPAFESAEQAIAATNVQLAVAHGLGRVPKLFRTVMRVKVAQNGFAAGDEVEISSINDGVRGTYQTWADAVNCYYIASTSNINVLARPSGGIVGFSVNARIVFYAW